MKNIIIILLSIIIMFLIGSFNEETSYFYNEKENTIIEDDLKDYLIGVVACEMPASFSTAALQAQAVASRTYAYYLKSINKKLTDDINTQCRITKNDMINRWGVDYNLYYNKIKDAVESTSNVVLTYNGKIVKAYYFSLSNGYTEDASFVFNEKEDYLKPVESLDDQTSKGYEKKISLSREEFCQKLKITCNNIVLDNIIKTTGNRIASIDINHKTYLGKDIRKILDLRSTDFEITTDDNSIIITTYGYGHGVGMSQYGANYMALKGYSYEDILKHYYQGVEITSIKL